MPPELQGRDDQHAPGEHAGGEPEAGLGARAARLVRHAGRVAALGAGGVAGLPEEQQKAIAEKLDSAAQFAYSEAQRAGVDMFGETIPTASREDVLEQLHA